MSENRKIKFYLEKLGDGKALEQKIKAVSGVINASVDADKMILSYELDDLASDYDAFAAAVQAAEETGCVIDFEKTDENAAENEESAGNFESAESTEISAESLKNPLGAPEEEAAAYKGENVGDVGAGDDEKAEYERDYGENEEKTQKKKKPKRAPSRTAQSMIELGAGVIAFVLGLVIPNSYGKLFMFALSFAVSGYELIYDVICDFAKKKIFTPKLSVLFGVAASLFLGYAEQAVGVTLVFVAAENAARWLKALALNKTVAKNADEKVVVISKKNGKNKEKETRLADVKTGDELSVAKGETCPFEATLTSPLSTVLRAVTSVKKGVKKVDYKEIELKKGAKIYKGDEFLSNSTVCVSVGFSDELNAKQRDFISRTEQQTSFGEFGDKRGNVVYGCVIALLAVIAFVLPVFAETYKTGLYRWGYTSATLAILCGAALADAASLAAGVLSLGAAYRNGVTAFGQKDCVKAAKCNLIAFDYENALCSDGSLKADALGAARELKDAGKKLALLTLLSDEEAKEICKQLKMSEYYCFETENERLAKMKELSESGVLCVTSADKADGFSIGLGAEKCDEVKAAAYIESDEIAYVPYVYKLAVKAAKAKKFALGLSVAVKAALAAAACFGVIQIWWVALADLAAGLICCAVSVSNIREIK